MKLQTLSWNVQGLHDPYKWKVIISIMRLYKLDLVCLQETKISFMTTGIVGSHGVGSELEMGFS